LFDFTWPPLDADEVVDAVAALLVEAAGVKLLAPEKPKDDAVVAGFVAVEVAADEAGIVGDAPPTRVIAMVNSP